MTFTSAPIVTLFTRATWIIINRFMGICCIHNLASIPQQELVPTRIVLQIQCIRIKKKKVHFIGGLQGFYSEGAVWKRISLTSFWKKKKRIFIHFNWCAEKKYGSPKNMGNSIIFSKKLTGNLNNSFKKYGKSVLFQKF